jgi:hypothetical protein
MSLYDAIRAEGKKNQQDLSIRDVAKIAGTMKLAEVTEASPAFPDLVKQEIERILSLGAGSQDSFRQIAASLDKGACPRCGKGTQEVKLFDYTASNYCQDCHISLWPNEEPKK